MLAQMPCTLMVSCALQMQSAVCVSCICRVGCSDRVCGNQGACRWRSIAGGRWGVVDRIRGQERS
eukprot:4791638-Lingulodinium_polyedra.AAC.1